LAVDRFIGEFEMVVRPLDARLGKVPSISAAALMDDGSPVLIVDVEDLARSVETLLHGGRLRGLGRTKATQVAQKRILVVDDSVTVREVQRSLLRNRGYLVEVAVDGMDGWNALRAGAYDLTITDVDMPRMTGIELVSKIKGDPKLHALPVIIVSYKDREEDRMRGLDAGADRYLTKSSFHDETLISAVEELIGLPE
jgi:two-component system sensor histidine kinase and response regulator WspE